MCISIIIPIYNVENYLRQCINSVLAQTFLDFELILVDDGSTDKSGEICDKYAEKDNRIKVVHQENKGVSSSRNIGLDISSGEWILFVDSDDILLDGALNTLYEASIMNQSADIIISGMQKAFINKGIEENVLIEDNFYYKEQFDILCLYLKGLYFYGFVCSKLYKANIIKNNNIRFNNKISYHEDELFFTQVLTSCTTVRTISKITYRYNRFEGTLTHRFVSLETQLYTANAIYDEAKKISFSEKYQDYVLNEFVSQLLFSIRSMYSIKFHNKLSYKERIKALINIYECAECRGLKNRLLELMDKEHFYVKTPLGVEVIGKLKYIKDKVKS